MTNLHRLALLGLALAGVNLQLPAADSPALDDNLKFFTKYLGQWAYKWKNETNGQWMSGYISTEIGLGGKTIMFKERLFNGDKTVSSSIGFNYWHPRAKTVLGWGCGTDGGHACGIQTRYGENLSGLWLGWDDKGQLGANLGIDEWKDNDTFVWQATLSSTNGIAKPDSQRVIIQRVKKQAFPPEEKPALRDNLKPMERYLGQWNVEWVENGKAMKAVTSVTVAAGGTATLATMSNIVDSVLQPAGWVGITYWRSEYDAIATLDLYGDGGFSESILTKGGDEVVWQETGFTGRGKYKTSVWRDQWLDQDTFVSQGTQTTEGGEFKPDGPKFSNKRIKP